MSRTIWSRHDHRACQSNLSAYVDGEVSPQLARRIERHLAACDACRAEAESLRALKTALHSLPLRAVPRSFVLPRSAVVERRRYRHWQTGFTALRGAAAALSLALMLLLSGNALLAHGLWRPASQAVATVDQDEPVVFNATAPEPAVGEMAAEDAAEQAAEPASEPINPTVAPTLTPSPLPATTAPGTDAAAPAAMAVSQEGQQASAAEDEPAEESSAKATTRVDVDEQRGLLSALAEEPRPASEVTEAADDELQATGSGGYGAGDAEAVSAEAVSIQPTPDESALSQNGPVEAPATATPQPTLEPAATSTPEPTAAPTMAPTTVIPTAALVTEAPVAAAITNEEAAPKTADEMPLPAEVEEPQSVSDPVAVLQSGLRTAISVLIGLLLMVAGGLLWVAYMRRR